MTNAARCLLELDVAGMRQVNARAGGPPLGDDASVIAAMHAARTKAESFSLRVRAWSHRWLTERGLPSLLPDELRPPAERMFPTIVEAVGVSCSSSSPWLRPIAKRIESLVSYKVAMAYADGDRDPMLIRQIIREEYTRQKRYFAEMLREQTSKPLS